MKQDLTFQFPPSIQSDLWNYLKPEQQEFIKPILRILKKPAQQELCCSLLDFMETGDALPPTDLTLAAIFMYLTREGLPEDYEVSDKRIIRPLKVNSRQPQPIGNIIKQIFPSFNS